MTLEFNKVMNQIETMGRFVAHRTESMSERSLRAQSMLMLATDLEEIWRKIELARTNDAGYRGAAPFQEPIHQAYSLTAPAPADFTVIAVDGSQVYPDQYGPALYYLTNIGAFVYQQTGQSLPECHSFPELVYNESRLRDRQNNLIKNTVVNARRSVLELETLASMCEGYLEQELPLLALMDGPLLWWTSSDIPDWQNLSQAYRGALKHLRELDADLWVHSEQRVHLAGYVDHHDSRFVVRLLYLLSLEDEDVRRTVLDTLGDLEGLNDKFLFATLLQPGERSALMIQQSPQNKEYRQQVGADYEITFFYLNVGSAAQPHIVRVEVPMWVAASPEAINEVQGILLEQCKITGSYPYSLTRADEIAVVTNQEKKHLNELITMELLRNQQEIERSPKLIGKEQSRGYHRRSYQEKWR